jgi:hypothetical protein
MFEQLDVWRIWLAMNSRIIELEEYKSYLKRFLLMFVREDVKLLDLHRISATKFGDPKCNYVEHKE